jgi:hypothetical protein
LSHLYQLYAETGEDIPFNAKKRLLLIEDRRFLH